MAGLKTLTQAIFDRLRANWTTTDIVYPNTDFKPTTGQPFIGVQIDTLVSGQISIASPSIDRISGVLSIEVLTPINEGVGLALEYAEILAAIFRKVRFNGVLMFSPNIASGQQIKYSNSKWWNTPLACPFQYDAVL